MYLCRLKWSEDAFGSVKTGNISETYYWSHTAVCSSGTCGWSTCCPGPAQIHREKKVSMRFYVHKPHNEEHLYILINLIIAYWHPAQKSIPYPNTQRQKHSIFKAEQCINLWIPLFSLTLMFSSFLFSAIQIFTFWIIY